MFPSKAVLYFSLFNDEALYLEQYQRFSFWYQENFHGVNLSALKDESINECFRQPIVVCCFNVYFLLDDLVETVHSFEILFGWAHLFNFI